MVLLPMVSDFNITSHTDPATTADQVANFERFTALGLDVALTELDVTASSSSPSAEEQTQQSNVYKNTVAACQQVKKCVGVTIWGYDDNYSWLSTKAPLPWYQPGGANSALVRKSLYDGIAAGWGAGGGENAQTASSGNSSTESPSSDNGDEASGSESNAQSWNLGSESKSGPETTAPVIDTSAQTTQTIGTTIGNEGSHDKCEGRLRKLKANL